MHRPASLDDWSFLMIAMLIEAQNPPLQGYHQDIWRENALYMRRSRLGQTSSATGRSTLLGG